MSFKRIGLRSPTNVQIQGAYESGHVLPLPNGCMIVHNNNIIVSGEATPKIVGNLWAVGAAPRIPLGALSAPQTPSWWGGVARTPPPLSALGPSGLAPLPPMKNPRHAVDKSDVPLCAYFAMQREAGTRDVGAEFLEANPQPGRAAWIARKVRLQSHR